jgi:hypothetical protein
MTESEALAEVAKWPDNIKVSAEIRNIKYDICKACEFFDLSKTICTKCKCDMELLTWSKSMGRCPIRKFKGENL